MTLRALALPLACAFAFASCGGEDGGGRDAEAAIEKSIVTFAKTDDPADCRKLATAKFLKTGGVTYEAGRTFCEEAAVNPDIEDAEKVTVSKVKIQGDSATAVAAYVGSGLDGQTLKLALVEQDGQWKHDEVLAFVDLDREQLVVEIGREMLLMAQSPQEAESLACVVGYLEGWNDRDLEGLVIGYSTDRLLRVAQTCAGRSSAL